MQLFTYLNFSCAVVGPLEIAGEYAESNPFARSLLNGKPGIAFDAALLWQVGFIQRNLAVGKPELLDLAPRKQADCASLLGYETIKRLGRHMAIECCAFGKVARDGHAP